LKIVPASGFLRKGGEMATEIADGIEGIEPAYADRLARVGISTLEDLRRMDIEAIHQETGISLRNLTNWQPVKLLVGR